MNFQTPKTETAMEQLLNMSAFSVCLGTIWKGTPEEQIHCEITQAGKTKIARTDFNGFQSCKLKNISEFRQHNKSLLRYFLVYCTIIPKQRGKMEKWRERAVKYALWSFLWRIDNTIIIHK